MAEHRVPMLGAALRRASLRGKVDPAVSTDPQVREIVSALALLPAAPAPRADFRAELRAQLVAVTPRLVAEGDPSLSTSDEPAERRHKAERAAPTTGRGHRFVRPLIATACLLTAFVVLLGGAVWMSKKALPGDALYGVKRASEDTEYRFTGGMVDKAKLNLEFAGNRLHEVAELLPRANAMSAGVGAVADSGINDETAALVRKTLGSADGDVRAAAALLTQNATQNKSAAPLAVLTTWAPDQIDFMQTEIVGRIPTADTQLHERAMQTWTLIVATDKRAQQLAATIRAAAPAGTRSTPSPSSTATPSSTAPRPTGPRRPTDAPARTTTAPGARTPTSPATNRGSGRASQKPGVSPPKVLPTPSIPGVSLPGLPTPSGLPSLPPLPTSSAKLLPVHIDSCGVSVSLGPLGVHLGSC